MVVVNCEPASADLLQRSLSTLLGTFNKLFITWNMIEYKNLLFQNIPLLMKTDGQIFEIFSWISDHKLPLDKVSYTFKRCLFIFTSLNSLTSSSIIVSSSAPAFKWRLSKTALLISCTPSAFNWAPNGCFAWWKALCKHICRGKFLSPKYRITN